MPRALVLGGTQEARNIAAALTTHDYAVTLALKGLTKNPTIPRGVTRRVGGFGGAAGLAAYLHESRTDLLIDATHPFAATMSWNAHHAVQLRPTVFFAIQRPKWTRQPGDRWKRVGTLRKAAICLRYVPPRRVLLALGGQGAEGFRMCSQHKFQARVLVNSNTALATLSSHRWRGLSLIRIDSARTIGDEIHTLRDFSADLMIVRNAGGQLDAKLIAARRLSLPVWMVDRPAMPPVPLFSSPSALIARIMTGMESP